MDKKNPHLICCATIDAVKDDQVHVTFDGWKGAFDYWTRYDSRDIFQVGWCERSLHPMQQPNSNANKRKSGKPSNTTIPDSDSMPIATPITVHFHAKCRLGRLIDGTKLRPMVTATTHRQLAQLCFQEILACSTDKAHLSRLLYKLEGEEDVVTAAGQNFTVSHCLLDQLNENFVRAKIFLINKIMMYDVVDVDIHKPLRRNKFDKSTSGYANNMWSSKFMSKTRHN